MKKKSIFSQIILLIILSIVCVVLTVGIALLVGSNNTTLFDWENLNFSNAIPVLIIGGFISCVIVGITVLFVARSVFFQVKDYLSDKTKNGGDTK